jgi:transposase
LAFLGSTRTQEGFFMSHPNAALTPRHRLTVARLVVDDGWPISEVAARFQVS